MAKYSTFQVKTEKNSMHASNLSIKLGGTTIINFVVLFGFLVFFVLNENRRVNRGGYS
jgi:hypothetical protein